MKAINEILKTDSKKAKKLFDLCNEYGEGMFNKIHIIESSRFPDERREYRIYHADGYCFEVVMEKIDLADDESNDSSIKGYEYIFNERAFEGFKEIGVEKAINFLKEI